MNPKLRVSSNYQTRAPIFYVLKSEECLKSPADRYDTRGLQPEYKYPSVLPTGESAYVGKIQVLSDQKATFSLSSMPHVGIGMTCETL